MQKLKLCNLLVLTSSVVPNDLHSMVGGHYGSQWGPSNIWLHTGLEELGQWMTIF